MGETGSRVGSRVGRGGMGEVHEAYATVKGRTVARKLMSPEVSSDPVFRQRIEPENILITGDDFAYLVDFGIAAALTEEHLTQTGVAVGTCQHALGAVSNGVLDVGVWGRMSATKPSGRVEVDPHFRAGSGDGPFHLSAFRP